MKSRTIVFLVCLTLALVSAHPSAQQPAAAAAPPGVSTGEKIGAIVKAAITTALPGVKDLLDIIWSHSTQPARDTAKKTDLQQAAQQPATQQAVTDKIALELQTRLQPLQKVADEIAVVQKFLEPAVATVSQLIVIRTKMKDATPDWVTIGNAWELAKAQMNKIKAIPSSDLDKVRDKYFRTQLGKISSANDSDVLRVNQDIAQRNVDDLKADVASLLVTLGDMPALAGYEFAELQSDLNDLAKWARGAAAAGSGKPDQKVYVDYLNTRFPADR